MPTSVHLAVCQLRSREAFRFTKRTAEMQRFFGKNHCRSSAVMRRCKSLHMQQINNKNRHKPQQFKTMWAAGDVWPRRERDHNF